ncbi:hypothetical protein Tco_1265145 [Tanacetum coccineum]
MVPLRSDTIRLVQNRYSFHRLRFEDPNQHIKDFLKIVDSLDLDVANRERINQSAGGKVHDGNVEELWALLEDLALYDNESWNDPRDFAKPVKSISLPQDILSTSDRRLVEFENQVQRLMEAHLALKQSAMIKITSLCEICSVPYDTQYCMENSKQAFVDYVSSCIDEAGGKWYTFKPEKNNLGDTYNPSWKSHPNLRPNSFLESSGLVPRSSDTKFIYTKEDDGDVMFIEIIKKFDDSRDEELEEDENAMIGGLGVEYFEILPTRSELTYHMYLMSGQFHPCFSGTPSL